MTHHVQKMNLVYDRQGFAADTLIYYNFDVTPHPVPNNSFSEIAITLSGGVAPYTAALQSAPAVASLSDVQYSVVEGVRVVTAKLHNTDSGGSLTTTITVRIGDAHGTTVDAPRLVTFAGASAF